MGTLHGVGVRIRVSVRVGIRQPSVLPLDVLKPFPCPTAGWGLCLRSGVFPVIPAGLARSVPCWDHSDRSYDRSERCSMPMLGAGALSQVNPAFSSSRRSRSVPGTAGGRPPSPTNPANLSASRFSPKP